jgi:SAM-dependent methyltransferase
MTPNDSETVRNAVRDNYAAVARQGGAASSCCGSGSDGDSGCCGGTWNGGDSLQVGYNADELAVLPAGADMNLGCGNPGAIAALVEGERVVDLGCGGGIDCFLAAKKVGATGKVIGVDMTPEMLAKARAFATEGGYDNVEFRLGEIEHLPIADEAVDVIISNCVVNLSPDKRSVLAETFRVLAPGGRLAISDVVATKAMPQSLLDDLALLCGCMSGAAMVDELAAMLAEVGFEQIDIQLNEASREFISQWAPGKGVEDYVVSATIQAVKPTA